MMDPFSCYNIQKSEHLPFPGYAPLHLIPTQSTRMSLVTIPTDVTMDFTGFSHD